MTKNQETPRKLLEKEEEEKKKRVGIDKVPKNNNLIKEVKSEF